MADNKTPFNPSRSATARVKNPLPPIEECRYCGGKVAVLENKIIYGRNYGEYPWMYICLGCNAYVGLHPFTNIPLGTLANAQLRKFRNECKDAFNQIWRDKHMTRSEAYAWLADQMGIDVGVCHFGWFEREECLKAEVLCRDYLEKLGY